MCSSPVAERGPCEPGQVTCPLRIVWFTTEPKTHVEPEAKEQLTQEPRACSKGREVKFWQITDLPSVNYKSKACPLGALGKPQEVWQGLPLPFPSLTRPPCLFSLAAAVWGPACPWCPSESTACSLRRHSPVSQGRCQGKGLRVWCPVVEWPSERNTECSGTDNLVSVTGREDSEKSRGLGVMRPRVALPPTSHVTLGTSSPEYQFPPGKLTPALHASRSIVRVA